MLSHQSLAKLLYLPFLALAVARGHDVPIIRHEVDYFAV